MNRSAIVVGGSIGGLFCANLLERAGWTVTVLERTAEVLSSRGAGAVTHTELYAALEAAGVDGSSIFGIDVEHRTLFDGRSGATRQIRLRQRLAAWGQIYRALLGGLRTCQVRQGACLVAVEQRSASVTAVLSDGERLTADLLIGADGVRSTVRRQVLPGDEPTYAGYVGWRGLVEEADMTPPTRQALLSCFAFDFPPGEQIVGYPVARPHVTVAGEPVQWNYVWYRPTPEYPELEQLLTGTDGQVYPDGIPPMLLRPEVLDRMRADAIRVLAPPISEAVCKTRLPMLQPIYDLRSSRLAIGRVALVGDAAFVARPHCGMGVTKAGSDAVALAQSLAETDDVEAALRAYEGRRLAIGNALVEHAQELGDTIDQGAAARHWRASPARQDELVRSVAVAWSP